MYLELYLEGSFWHVNRPKGISCFLQPARTVQGGSKMLLRGGRTPLARLAAAHALRPFTSSSVSHLTRPALAQSRSHAATRPCLAPLGVAQGKCVRLLSSPAQNSWEDEDDFEGGASDPAGTFPPAAALLNLCPRFGQGPKASMLREKDHLGSFEE